MRKTRTLGIALAALGLATMTACPSGGDAKTESGPAPAAALPVTVVEAVGENVQRTIDVTGTLAPWEEATVAMEAEGRIVDVRGDLGDPVKKGEVLARVNPIELQARVAQADAEQSAATADLARIQQLAAKDMATKQQVDEAKRRVDVARTNVDIARKKLGDAVVHAPFDGMIARRLVNLGDFARIGNPAFQLVRVSPLKLKADVAERYAADVKVDDPVEARGEALGKTVLEGKVARIGPSVAQDTRSFPVEARIENADGAVKPGTFARMTIRTSTTAGAVTVPDLAVVLFAGNPRVYVIDGDKARERPVQLGEKVRDRVVISQGLKAGEKVAISGLDVLSDGALVVVRPPEAREAAQ